MGVIGIGAAIAGAWAAVGAATVAGVAIGTVLQGAIIGAAIGGISAAVTGGSLGKGILFGAVGGAVAGGISGMVAGSGVGWTGAAANTGVSQAAGQTAAHSVSALNVAGSAAATKAVTAAGTGTISGALGNMGSEVLAKGLVAGIEGYMGNEAQEDMIEAQKEESALAHERNKETMRLAAELSEGSKGSAQAVDNTGAELSYNARMSELDQRKNEFDTQTAQTRKEWDTEMERRAQRRSLFSGGSNSAAPEVSEGTSDGGSLIEKRQGNVEVSPTSALTGPAPMEET